MISFSSLITAIRTLTIIPVPGKDTKFFTSSIPFFPVIGFILAGIVLLLFMGFQQIITVPELMVILILIIETGLTGFLHVDGLADLADGLGSGKKGKDMILVLKDSRVGVFGVCAIVFDLLLKALCWYTLYKARLIAVILFSLIAARCIQALYTGFLPQAYKMSLLKSFNEKTIAIKIWILLVIAGCIVIGGYSCGWRNTAVLSSVALVNAALLGSWCLRKIGGITGDCIGAANEITELSVLVTGIILLN